MDDARKLLVATGYDELGDRYQAWAARVEGDPRARYVADLSGRLPAGAPVLDLGCGSGLPSTADLAEHFDVVGVDASAAQLAQARRNVPNALFLEGDLASSDFPPESFAAVTAFYSITHVPRDEHARLFRNVLSWLRPGGFFLATLGAGDGPDWTGEWLGVPMFFSCWDSGTNRALLREAGFELVTSEVVEIREPEGPVPFLWVLARRPE